MTNHRVSETHHEVTTEGNFSSYPNFRATSDLFAVISMYWGEATYVINKLETKYFTRWHVIVTNGRNRIPNRAIYF